MCISTPVGSYDLRAFESTSLSDVIKHPNFPAGKYLIGDNEYLNSDHSVTPFSGADINDEAKSNFNLFVSQIRIKMEQEFGFMTNKWRILRRPMRCRLSTTAKVMLCISILHNYVINQGEVPDDINSRDENGERVFLDSDPDMKTVDDISYVRDILVNRI